MNLMGYEQTYADISKQEQELAEARKKISEAKKELTGYEKDIKTSRENIGTSFKNIGISRENIIKSRLEIGKAKSDISQRMVVLRKQRYTQKPKQQMFTARQMKGLKSKMHGLASSEMSLSKTKKELGTKEQELKKAKLTLAEEEKKIVGERKKIQSAEQELQKVEPELSKFKQKMKEYETGGYDLSIGDAGKLMFSKQVKVQEKVRVTDKVAVMPEVSQKVTWVTKEGKTKTFQTSNINIPGNLKQIKERGGVVISIKSMADPGSKHYKYTYRYEYKPSIATETKKVDLPTLLKQPAYAILTKHLPKEFFEPEYQKFRSQFLEDLPKVYKPTEKMITTAYITAQKPIESAKTLGEMESILKYKQMFTKAEIDIEKEKIIPENLYYTSGKFLPGSQIIKDYDLKTKKVLSSLKESEMDVKKFGQEFRKLKEQEPALYVTIDRGKISTGLDVTRWHEDFYKGKPAWQKTVASGIGKFANIEYIYKSFTGTPPGMETIGQPSYKDVQKEALAKWEYGTYKLVSGKQSVLGVKHPVLGLTAGVVSVPGMKNIAIPFAGGMILKPIMGTFTRVGTQLATKGTGLATRTLGKTVYYSPYVFGGVTGGIIAGDIIVTAHKEKIGELEPGTTAIKMGTVATQLYSLGAGMKASPKYTGKTVRKMKSFYHGTKISGKLSGLKLKVGKLGVGMGEKIVSTKPYQIYRTGKIDLYVTKLKVSGKLYSITKPGTKLGEIGVKIQSGKYVFKEGVKGVKARFKTPDVYKSKMTVRRGKDYWAGRKQYYKLKHGTDSDLIVSKSQVSVVGKKGQVTKFLYDVKGVSRFSKKAFVVTGKGTQIKFSKEGHFFEPKSQRSIYHKPGETVTFFKGEMKYRGLHGTQRRDVFSIGKSQDMKIPDELAAKDIRYSKGAGLTVTGKTLSISGGYTKQTMRDFANIRYTGMGAFRTSKIKGLYIEGGEMVDISQMSYEPSAFKTATGGKQLLKIDTTGMQVSISKAISKGFTPTQQYITKKPLFGSYQHVKPVSVTTGKVRTIGAGFGTYAAYGTTKISLRELEAMEEGIDVSSSKWQTVFSIGKQKSISDSDYKLVLVGKQEEIMGMDKIGLLGGVKKTVWEIERPEIKTGIRSELDRRVEQKPDVVLGTVSGLGLKQRLAQVQVLETVQQQKLDLRLGAQFAHVVSIGKTQFTGFEFDVPTVKTTVTPPPPSLFPRRRKKGEFKMSSKKITVGLSLKKQKPKSVFVRDVLAEPFRVMRSQVKFGKATHPKATKKLWALGQKTGWKIPTVELVEEERRKGKAKKKEKFEFGKGKIDFDWKLGK